MIKHVTFLDWLALAVVASGWGLWILMFIWIILSLAHEWTISFTFNQLHEGPLELAVFGAMVIAFPWAVLHLMREAGKAK